MKAVLFTSVPQCGTHLLLNYFQAVGFEHAGPFGAIRWDESFIGYVRNLQPGQYSAWHFPWRPDLAAIVAEKNIRVVFLYRDPRAQLVSQMHFIMRTPEHPWHRYLSKGVQTNDERLARIIEGVPDEARKRYFEGVPVRESVSSPLKSKLPFGTNSTFGSFAGWLEEPQCLPVRFEDIVGARGGGEASRQTETVGRLLDFTGVSSDAGQPRAVADALFDERSPTFRQGRIDSWRADFSAPVNEVFMRESKELLDLFGYEP